jgi:PPOX class probable FMN-dependent enzyme
MITTIAELESHYGTPADMSFRKVADRMVPVYRRWIMASRFVVLTTVGPEGTDGSPRGDDGPVVLELDDRTLAMPDWKGNDRIDSLRNIVADGRVSLMFMVPGSANVVRVNGRAHVTADARMIARFQRGGKSPRSVIVIKIGEIYFQCARALMRSRLWTAGDESADLPKPGEILADLTNGRAGGSDYDAKWPARARDSLW